MTIGWPNKREEWLRNWEKQALTQTALRLSVYPVLNPFYKQTAALSIAQAQEISIFLEYHEGYFKSEPEFGRWFCLVSFRESLRLIVRHEPVDAAFDGLDYFDRRLLNWSYVDQFTQEQIAKLIPLSNGGKPTSTHPEPDRSSNARELVLQAYSRLCTILERRNLVPQHFIRNGRYRDVSSLFPLPPVMARMPKQC